MTVLRGVEGRVLSQVRLLLLLFELALVATVDGNLLEKIDDDDDGDVFDRHNDSDVGSSTWEQQKQLKTDRLPVLLLKTSNPFLIWSTVCCSVNPRLSFVRLPCLQRCLSCPLFCSGCLLRPAPVL